MPSSMPQLLPQWRQELWRMICAAALVGATAETSGASKPEITAVTRQPERPIAGGVLAASGK